MSITLRPAQPHDKAAITALATKIWNGEDYLHLNFDNWVAQERGRFVVAHHGQQLVGCNKLTELHPGEWWMEGLRVDPAWRGQGIARLLHQNILQLAGEIAVAEKLTGHLRFATASETPAVHKLARDTGFIHTNSHLLYTATVPTKAYSDPLPFTPISLSEKQALEAWLARSATFAAYHGLFEDAWKWYEIQPRLSELLHNGRLYWWRKSKDSAAGLVIIHHNPETMVLNYLDAPDGRYAELLEDVRLLARGFNATTLKSKPLATSEIKAARQKTAWEIDYDLEMWVFQRPIG